MGAGNDLFTGAVNNGCDEVKIVPVESARFQAGSADMIDMKGRCGGNTKHKNSP
jgi:hypothetical protein